MCEPDHTGQEEYRENVPGGAMAHQVKQGSGFDLQRLPWQGYLQNNRTVVTLFA